MRSRTRTYLPVTLSAATVTALLASPAMAGSPFYYYGYPRYYGNYAPYYYGRYAPYYYGYYGDYGSYGPYTPSLPVLPYGRSRDFQDGSRG